MIMMIKIIIIMIMIIVITIMMIIIMIKIIVLKKKNFQICLGICWLKKKDNNDHTFSRLSVRKALTCAEGHSVAPSLFGENFASCRNNFSEKKLLRHCAT